MWYQLADLPVTLSRTSSYLTAWMTAGSGWNEFRPKMDNCNTHMQHKRPGNEASEETIAMPFKLVFHHFLFFRPEDFAGI